MTLASFFRLPDFLKRSSARNGLGSLAAHASRIVLQLLTAVVVARLLLPDGLGRYSFVMALVAIAVVPAQFGLSTLLLRETARANAGGDWIGISQLWRWSAKIMTASTGTVTLVLLVCGLIFMPTYRDLEPAAYYLGVFLVPLIAVVNFGEAALQGLGRTFVGMLAGYIVRPTLYIFLVGSLLLFGHSLYPASAILLQLVAHAAVATLILVILYRQARGRLVRSSPSSHQGRSWLKSTLTFVFLQGMWVILSQTDMVMLGVMSTAGEVGLYRVASTGAAFVIVGMTALNVVMSERFSYFYARRAKERLQTLATFGVVGAFALAAPLAIAFMIWGETIVTVMFGRDYAAAGTTLAILAAGQLVHVAAGYAPTLLAMVGDERTNAWTLGPAALLNIALNLLLIPKFGASGAASATAVTIGLQGAVMWALARRRLGVETSIAGGLLRAGKLMFGNGE